MQYFKNRDAQQESQEDEVWQKMRNAGPAQTPDSPSLPPKDVSMSREGSSEGPARVDQFANPVSWLHAQEACHLADHRS